VELVKVSSMLIIYSVSTKRLAKQTTKNSEERATSKN